MFPPYDKLDYNIGRTCSAGNVPGTESLEVQSEASYHCVLTISSNDKTTLTLVSGDYLTTNQWFNSCLTEKYFVFCKESHGSIFWGITSLNHYINSTLKSVCSRLRSSLKSL